MNKLSHRMTKKRTNKLKKYELSIVTKLLFFVIFGRLNDVMI